MPLTIVSTDFNTIIQKHARGWGAFEKPVSYK